MRPRSAASWQRHLGRHGRVAPRTLRRALARGSLASVAERTLAAREHVEVLRVDKEAVTGGELLARSGALALGLAGSGTSRVLLAMEASVDFVAAYLGVLRSGCSAMIANPGLTRFELDRLVSAGVPALGLVSARTAETLDLTGSAKRVGPAALLVDLGSGAGRLEAGEAVLAHTSGSTGEPKGVPLTNANLLSSMRAAMASWRWSPADVVVHCLPLHHQHGLGSLHALWLGGGRTVIQSRFDPAALAHAVKSERATVLLAVPAIYRRLVEAAPRREDFASLRLAVSGSAPLPPVVFDQIIDLTGQVPVERYGMTESGLDLSNLYDGNRRSGSVGYALPGVEVAIGGEPGEDEALDGTDGEILLRGPQIFAGYLDGGTDGLFTPGRYLRTGDIGRVDPEDGSISITGRSKDVIISGGLNVYPREVELVLEQHPAVAAVAVGGVASERWGETVCAFVVPRRGEQLQRDQLESLCRGSLAPYKHPKQYLLVNDLPRNDMGKVLRSSLASLVEVGESLE